MDIQQRRIAFFYFDGTITTKDTLLEFIKFSKGNFRFYLGFALTSPWLFAYKAGLISNQQAKEKVLSSFFGGMPLASFNELCARFSEQKLDRLIRPKAAVEIRQLKEAGYTIVIVSASPENWLRTWAERSGLEVIATRLEVAEGRLTGRIAGKNCHGMEKVSRVKAIYDLEEFSSISAYGDTSGDKPLLSIAHTSFYKPFR